MSYSFTKVIVVLKIELAINKKIINEESNEDYTAFW